MTAPAPDAWAKLACLRQIITDDLADTENAWAADIAKKRNVTRAVVMALLFTPEAVSLCVQCMASGMIVNGKSEPCRHCGGRGYTNGVTIP